MRKIAILFTVLVFSLHTKAQFNIDAKVGSGLNGIIKFSQHSEYAEFSSAFSYNVGFEFSQRLWKTGEIAGDLLFFDKRTNVHLLLGMSEFVPDYTISFRYLSIPIYFRFEPGKNFYINLGYINNIYLNYKAREYDIINANSYTSGLLFGFEYRIFPKIKIGINAQADIEPFSNKVIEPVLVPGENSYYHYSFMFSLSYKIFSTKK